MSQKDRKKWLAALAIVLLLAALCVVLWHTGLLEKLKSVEQLQVYLASHTPWSQLIFLGLQLCSVIIAPIPSNIIAAAGGAAFGVWPGFLITLVAVLVGSCTTFTLARTLCKDFADRVIRPKLSPKYLELLDRKRDTFLALAFFFPLFPDDLLCIMAGLTEISFRRFFIIVLLTRPWGLLAANIFGSSLISFSPKAIPLLVIAVVIVIKRVGPFFTSLQGATDQLNLVVQEDLNAIRVVKSFVREAQEKEKFTQRSEKLRSMAERAFGFVVLFMPVMMILMGGTITAVMWIGGHYVWEGTLLSGDLIAFFTYVSEILMSLMMVSVVLMMLTRAIACGKRIAEVLEEKPRITDEQADPALTVEDGSIRFDHVYFKYHDTAEAWNLEDVSFTVPSGATVGILGGTGSAKTTLVSMIPRLYDVNGGAVYVGGHNVKNYTMEALRDGCAMVLQKNTLFSGTIRENLRWGDENASDQEIEAACRLACADEFIEKMPDGYDTYIEQGGTNVSGGQKQRLCIARAVLRKPKILILDDSTSAVDTATDAKIRGALKTALPGTTKLIIAQRITSVMDADLILVMDDGHISAIGTHEELMAQSDIYREVYRSQQEGVSIDG